RDRRRQHSLEWRMSAPAREKVAVTKMYRGVATEVEGDLLAPGLAITLNPDNQYQYRLSITHVPSGRSVVHNMCEKHIEDAAGLLLMADVDRTVAAELLVQQEVVRDLVTSTTKAIGRCRNACDGRPSWRV